MAEETFDERLYLDDYSVDRRLKVGRIDMPAPTRDAVGNEYRDQLLALPELSEQGDGMRSFFGQFLQLLARPYPVVLIDEPEAFLHPPQANRLGKALGQRCMENGQQIVIATHDRDLLAGLVDSGVELSVIRLAKRGSVRTGKQLPEQELKSVWADPAVRYSNALSGLFHKVVVLVEGDGDARFYGAALAETKFDERSAVASSDVLFVPCNGKGGMAKLARALRQLDVPVIASPDLDVLKNANELRALIEALETDWSTVKDLHEQALTGVPQAGGQLLVEDLRGVLPQNEKAPIDGDLKLKVQRFLSTAGDPWKAIKRGGTSAFGGGAPGKAVDDLVSTLDSVGIVVVRQGELESFDTSLGVSKGRWVATALEKGVHRSAEVASHMQRVLAASTGG